MAKPLIIKVAVGTDPTLVVALQSQGHEVTWLPLEITTSCDLILGPMCCRFLPGMEAFLPAVIKGARKVKYPTKEKAK